MILDEAQAIAIWQGVLKELKRPCGLGRKAASLGEIGAMFLREAHGEGSRDARPSFDRLGAAANL